MEGFYYKPFKKENIKNSCKTLHNLPPSTFETLQTTHHVTKIEGME